MKYKYKGDSPVVVMDLHEEFQPGETKEVDGVINSPLFEEVVDTKTAPKEAK